MATGILKPYTGLSFRKGNKEVNVHEVKDGTVYWGYYEDGDELPHRLHRCGMSDWNKMVRKALDTGATAFSRVRSSVQYFMGRTDANGLAKPPGAALCDRSA